mmetsp:Transcript_32101/g.54135  ORF Transcript_32101/g.54135 Transcript_32101/m.54135 type:complete len:101 (+) Transcript_32101:1223-1525(+)
MSICMQAYIHTYIHTLSTCLICLFACLLTCMHGCTGERAWLDVIENYQKNKEIEEYKANHGGRMPPESPLKVLAKLFFPCFFRDRVHIKVGMDMENRHRE